MKWQDKLAKYLEALRTTDFPVRSICSHHGVCVRGPGVRASVTIAATILCQAQIMMYRSGGEPVPLKTLQRWERAITRIGQKADKWNGIVGCNGLSLVLHTRLHPSFIRAIDNYHALSPNEVFHPSPETTQRFAAFTSTLEEALKRLGVEVKGD